MKDVSPYAEGWGVRMLEAEQSREHHRECKSDEGLEMPNGKGDAQHTKEQIPDGRHISRETCPIISFHEGTLSNEEYQAKAVR